MNGAGLLQINYSFSVTHIVFGLLFRIEHRDTESCVMYFHTGKNVGAVFTQRVYGRSARTYRTKSIYAFQHQTT
jgi:hypothetical protein